MENLVKQHYACPELASAIRAGLAELGKTTDKISTRDLGPVDQLHTGGAPATLALARRADLEPGARVLDAGCGIGGSTRLLAETFGLQMVGIDLAGDFIETAQTLTRWCDFPPATRDAIEFHQGSVTRLPFEPDSFDGVLCQHILMNIEDKPLALAEFYRVLKPGGRLLVHEIVDGPGPEPRLPVPWASDAAISFVPSPDELTTALTRAGFDQDYFSDETEAAAAGWQKINAIRQKKGISPLTPALIFGKKASFFGPNLEFNFSQKALGCIEIFLTKPG